MPLGSGGFVYRPSRMRCTSATCRQGRLRRTPPRLLGLIGQKRRRVGRTPTNAAWPVGACEAVPAARIPVSCSTAIPHPVRSASATMRLVIWWLMSAANRASLRRRFFSNRRAELVFLACNRFRSRNCRLRYRFSRVPGGRSPSLVVAMLTMPRSTPTNPLTGSASGASGASTVAYRNHCRPGGSGRSPRSRGSATAPDPAARPAPGRCAADRASSRSTPLLLGPDCVRDLPGQASRIERLRGVSAEFDRRLSHPHTARRSGRAIVAGGEVAPQRGVGIGDLADHPDRQLRR